MNWYNPKFLFHFYDYLLRNKTVDLIILTLLNFLLSLFPIIIVFVSVLWLDDLHQRTFFGDGSVIATCFGILGSYSAYLYEFKDEGDKKLKIILSVVMIVLYILMILIYRSAQLQINRSWEYINSIFIYSGIFIFLTFSIVTLLYFSREMELTTIKDYMDKKKQDKIAKKAAKLSKDKSGKISL